MNTFLLPAISRTTRFFALFVLLIHTVFASDLRYSTVSGAGGLPLQIVEAGPQDATGILFIHGWSLSSSSWQQQLESTLADEFHLVAIDLRGHGNSAKPWDAASYADSKIWADDIAAVIEATGLERPVVVAWSMGVSKVTTILLEGATSSSCWAGEVETTCRVSAFRRIETF